MGEPNDPTGNGDPVQTPNNLRQLKSALKLHARLIHAVLSTGE